MGGQLCGSQIKVKRPSGPPATAGAMIMKHYFFGTANFHEGFQELRVDGERVAIQPRQLQLLAELLRAQGNLVTRDTLLDRVWGFGATVQPCAIDQAVSRLRRNLGVNGWLIETRSKLGYRLDFSKVSVRPVDDDDEQAGPASTGHAGPGELRMVASGPRQD
jgi:DNA-binding winged helix-turn-helix (wHTH) protein